MANAAVLSLKQMKLTVISLMLLLPLMTHLASATNYTVGGALGWTFGVGGWENGKSFHAGDILTFKYPKIFHNVVKVDAEGYKSCKAGANSTEFRSGNDEIALEKGDNFFICTIFLHCRIFKMKISAPAS